MKSEARIVNTGISLMAKLRSVPLDSVRWTEGFWADRYNQNKKVTLRELWNLLADPEVGHVLDNFQIAAGIKKGDFAGSDWQDEWLYKWLEAAACIYRMREDEWIYERIEEAIHLIGQAQESDGYISTQITATGKARFQDPRGHEVYNMGHLITAGVIHHRMTGSESLLDVAVKACPNG